MCRDRSASAAESGNNAPRHLPGNEALCNGAGRPEMRVNEFGGSDGGSVTNIQVIKKQLWSRKIA